MPCFVLFLFVFLLSVVRQRSHVHRLDAPTTLTRNTALKENNGANSNLAPHQKPFFEAQGHHTADLCSVCSVIDLVKMNVS